jgi:hypothetical protein
MNLSKIAADIILVLFIFTYREIIFQNEIIFGEKKLNSEKVKLYFSIGNFGSNLIYAFIVCNLIYFLLSIRFFFKDLFSEP